MTLLTRLHKREEPEQRIEELEWAPITEGEDKCAEDDGDKEGDRRLGPLPQDSRTELPQKSLSQGQGDLGGQTPEPQVPRPGGPPPEGGLGDKGGRL